MQYFQQVILKFNRKSPEIIFFLIFRINFKNSCQFFHGFPKKFQKLCHKFREMFLKFTLYEGHSRSNYAYFLKIQTQKKLPKNSITLLKV